MNFPPPLIVIEFNQRWSTDMILKLLKSVLRNNYVETSGGLYLFGRVLPMGYKLSGEALNSVALAGEVSKPFEHGRNEVKCGTLLGELSN